MQIVSWGDNVRKTSNSIFWKNNEKNILKYCLLLVQSNKSSFCLISGLIICWCPAEAWGKAGRSCIDLHANDTRGHRCNASLCSTGCYTLTCLWWICLKGTFNENWSCKGLLHTIITLNIGTDRPEQTVKTHLIRMYTVCHLSSTIIDKPTGSKETFFKF